MSQKYDVVLYGIDQSRGAIDECTANLAKVFGTDAAQVETLIAGAGDNEGVVVKRNVTVKVALRLQGMIEQAGGIANFRPSRASEPASLQLVPIEETIEKPRFICPACNHKEDADGEGNLPKICPACGVVAEKYDHVSALKAERERVKRQLLATEQYREKQAEEADKRKKEKEMREALEADIRKELGIPRALSSRGRLLSTGAAIWSTGLAMGIVGAIAYQAAMHPEAGKQPTSAGFAMIPGMPGMSGMPEMPAGAMASIDPMMLESSMSMSPGLAAVSQIDGVSQLLPSATTDSATTPTSGASIAQFSGKPGAGGASGQLSEESSILLPPPAAAGQTTGLQVIAALEQDREWNGFLSTEVVRLLDEGKFDSALTAAQALMRPTMKARSLWEVADRAARGGDGKTSQQAEVIVNAVADAIPDAAGRVEYLTALASIEHEKGGRAKANSWLALAQKRADQIKDPAVKANALGYLAVFHIKQGQPKAAEDQFKKANALLTGITEKSAALFAHAQLAMRYLEAGDKIGATTALNHLTKTAVRTGDDELLREVALGFGAVGDLDAALAAAAKIRHEQMRDKARADVAKDQLFANRAYDAMKILESVVLPQYKAPALSWLAALLERQPQTRQMAADVQKTASDTAQLVHNPIDKALALSEAGRIASHAGALNQARERFVQALVLVQELPDSSQKDAALATVAGNQLRAGLTVDARQIIGGIKEPALSRLANDDFGIISPLFESRGVKSPLAAVAAKP